MKRSVIVDTNVLISFLEKKDSPCVQALADYDELLVTPTILGEYRAGISDNRKGALSRAALEDFLSKDSVSELTMTSRTSVFYAKVYQALKTVGCPIPVNDIWIAASAIENGVELCSFDRHFASVPMLQFRNLL